MGGVVKRLGYLPHANERVDPLGPTIPKVIWVKTSPELQWKGRHFVLWQITLNMISTNVK